MGIFRSIYRYVATLGGLIESDIDARTDRIVTSPSGIKSTFQKTREQWTTQYSEVRESVAQLMIILDKKKKKIDELAEEAKQIKLKMKGAVDQFKSGGNEKYKEAFTDLFNRDKKIAAEQEALNGEIKDLHSKVDSYKNQLKEMQKNIGELDQRESEAIADIVSSQQIINLNDRLNNLSTELDDRNLRAIEQRRDSLKSQAKLSSELSESQFESQDLEKELLEAGMNSEASDVFAAMLAEEEKKNKTETPETSSESRSRDI